MQKITKKPRHRILRWWPACFIFGFMAFLIAFTQAGTVNVHGAPTGRYYVVEPAPEPQTNPDGEYSFTTLNDVFNKMAILQCKNVEVQIYGDRSTLDLSAESIFIFGNKEYFNAKITFNDFKIHTKADDTTSFCMKSSVGFRDDGVPYPTFNSINFKNCLFDHSFQKIVPNRSINSVANVSYIGCDFSEHFSCCGDDFGDLTFENCTNVGMINANSHKMKASGDPNSVLTIANCTFTGNIQKDGDGSYPRFQKDGSHAIVYGNGFHMIDFHFNKWSTEEPQEVRISVDVYQAEEPYGGTLSNLNESTKVVDKSNMQNIMISDFDYKPYVLFPVYSYTTTADYYVRTISPDGSTILNKVNETPIVFKPAQELKHYSGKTLVSSIETNDDHSEILTYINKDPSEHRTYEGRPYFSFSETDPDYSQVSTKTQNNILANYNNNSNRVHLNYVIDVSNYVEVPLTADVSLDGNVPPDGKITLILEDDEGNVIDTEQNKGSVVDFEPLYYVNAPGEYTLKMRAQVNPEDGIEGDGAVYTVKIKVIESDNGYVATVACEKNGQEYEGIPLFEFKTLPAPIVPPEVTKILTGDNANTAVWVAMLALSAICLICLAIYNKKKKENLAKNEK